MVDHNLGFAARPRFRQDLVAEPLEDGGSRFIDVADPDSGHVYRFFEVEYSIACAMDGDRDVPGIIQWAKEELGLVTTPNEVKTVIATLGDLGYLERGAAAAAAARPEPVREAPRAAASPPAANKWEAPTAMGASEDYLGKGVVAAKPASKPAENVELGSAGPIARAVTPMPVPDDVALGAAGASAHSAVEEPTAADIPLGVAGRTSEPDMSMDLAGDVSVSPDDVKEAVRASQVMRAVEVPKELEEAIAPTMTARPESEPRVEPKRPPMESPARVEAKPAREEPKPVAREEKRPARPSVAPTAPARTVSPALIVLLLVVVLGAAAFVAYKYIIKKSAATEQATKPVPVEPVKPQPPPPPPVETQKLAVEQPADVELKASNAGVIEQAPVDGDVKAGDVIAKLAGHKPIDTEIAALETDITKRVQVQVDQAQKDRDAAQAAGNKGALTAAEAKLADRKKSLEDKEQKLAAKKLELDKYLVKAPGDGKLAAVAKANAKVTPTDVVAKLTPKPLLVATFKTKMEGVAKDAHVLLAVKGKETKLACRVVEASGGGGKVACPSDPTLVGAEVTFAGVDTSAPAEIEMGEETGSGSGSGSATGSGSGSGSATGSGSGSGSAAKAETPKPQPAVAPPPRPRPRPTPPAPKPPEKPADKPAEGSAAPPADKPAETPPASQPLQ